MKNRWPVALVAACASVVVILSGCGSSGGNGGTTATEPEPLDQPDRGVVERTQGTIGEYCRQVRLRTFGQRDPLSDAEQQRAFDAVDELIEVGRRTPGATVRPGVDVRTAISDLAENLEGSNCDPRVVQELDRGLASLPGR